MSIPTLEQVAEVRRVARKMREESDKKRRADKIVKEVEEGLGRPISERTATEVVAATDRIERRNELTATETNAAEELRRKRWEIEEEAGVEGLPPGPHPSGGVKHDAEKLRVDLLPVDVLKGVAGILTHGAKKYGDRNWEMGIKYSRLYGATLRHLFAFWEREDLDPDSKLHHLDHALCELMFLRAMSTRGKPNLDDRPREG